VYRPCPQSELNIFTVETYGRGFGPSIESRCLFEEERYRILIDTVAANEAAAEFVDGKTSYWLDRRKQFFRNTIFSLGEKTRKLGENFDNNRRKLYLPYCFDREVFEKMVTTLVSAASSRVRSPVKRPVCICPRRAYTILAESNRIVRNEF
jgi:hypothetical protein